MPPVADPLTSYKPAAGLKSMHAEMAEWATTDSLMLAVRGELAPIACRTLELRIRRLLADQPGLFLTLDLSAVTGLDTPAAESLFLSIVALRAGEARLQFASPSAPVQRLFTQLGLEAQPQGYSERVSVGRWPQGHWVTGVTA